MRNKLPEGAAQSSAVVPLFPCVPTATDVQRAYRTKNCQREAERVDDVGKSLEGGTGL